MNVFEFDMKYERYEDIFVFNYNSVDDSNSVEYKIHYISQSAFLIHRIK